MAAAPAPDFLPPADGARSHWLARGVPSGAEAPARAPAPWATDGSALAQHLILAVNHRLRDADVDTPQAGTPQAVPAPLGRDAPLQFLAAGGDGKKDGKKNVNFDEAYIRKLVQYVHKFHVNNAAVLTANNVPTPGASAGVGSSGGAAAGTSSAPNATTGTSSAPAAGGQKPQGAQ